MGNLIGQSGTASCRQLEITKYLDDVTHRRIMCICKIETCLLWNGSHAGTSKVIHFSCTSIKFPKGGTLLQRAYYLMGLFFMHIGYCLLSVKLQFFPCYK